MSWRFSLESKASTTRIHIFKHKTFSCSVHTNMHGKTQSFVNRLQSETALTTYLCGWRKRKDSQNGWSFDLPVSRFKACVVNNSVGCLVDRQNDPKTIFQTFENPSCRRGLLIQLNPWMSRCPWMTNEHFKLRFCHLHCLQCSMFG